ncbi:MAG TPA: sigma-70 family RNA polymerase sigma factor [Ktedonobacteraceae bacterium]|nr:sigma-70 family RNA polymerase sigma factor [Ktedonobacteraceae bacterium]
MQQHEPATDINADDATLFDRYGQAVFAYLRLHSITREDAEDLLVEVFTAALEQDQLSALPEENRLAWLRRVAHNKLVDSYRRMQRRPIVALGQGEEMLSNVYDDNPERVAIQQESNAQLHQAVGTLPLVQQQVLRLRYGDGLRLVDIAALLNKREEAVRKLHSRALAQLRGIFIPHLRGGDRA